MLLNANGMRVFLSGPITGMPDYNREAFADAEKYLRGCGAKWVYNPSKLAPRSGSPKLHAEYMRETLHELTGRSDTRGRKGGGNYYDAIVMLPGWKGSVGARMEMSVAETIGIEVIEL